MRVAATSTTAPDGAGLFAPDSVTWRVNREAVLLAGGGRALLMQVAHPLVAAGVAEHSDYQRDPWGRLYRTLDVTTAITFGDAEESAQASRRLDRRHSGVKGEADGGERYDARDPDLLLWVWATLVDSALLVYSRYVTPLPVADVWRYYEEQKRFAYACGVPEGHCPDSYPEFNAYLLRMIAEELRVTDAARAVADSVMHPRLPWPILPALKLPNNLVTVGLLPPALRAAYGFEWGPGRERLLSASTTAVRRLLPTLPSALREFPAARAAARRRQAA